MNLSCDRKKALIATIALLLTAGSLTGGCSGKDKAASTAPLTVGQNGANTASGAAKPTPEQEAAKQQAIQQGPAIEAALKAQQGH